MLTTTRGADRLAPRFGLRKGRRPFVALRAVRKNCLLDFRRGRRSLDRKFLVTGFRAHFARGLTEKDAGPSRAIGSGVDDQGNLGWPGEIAGMNQQVALGQKDPTADVGVIPTQYLH